MLAVLGVLMRFNYRDIILVLLGAVFIGIVNLLSFNQSPLVDVVQKTTVANNREETNALSLEHTKHSPPSSDEYANKPLNIKSMQSTVFQHLPQEAEPWYRVAIYFSQRKGSLPNKSDLHDQNEATNYLSSLVTDSYLPLSDRLTIAEAINRLNNQPTTPKIANYLLKQLSLTNDAELQIAILRLLNDTSQAYPLNDLIALLDNEQHQFKLAFLELLINSSHEQAPHQKAIDNTPKQPQIMDERPLVAQNRIKGAP
jgi:hypothetical protein